jgi:hypothetical protein
MPAAPNATLTPMAVHLDAALYLVNSRPFSYVDWSSAVFDGLAAAATAAVCDVATMLGARYLEHNDPAGALHAVQQARQPHPDPSNSPALSCSQWAVGFGVLIGGLAGRHSPRRGDVPQPD